MMIRSIAIVVSCIVCFGLGVLWSKYSLLNDAVITKSELKLQADSNQIGLLPEGSTLYPYSSGSTETYILFVNSKNLNLLESVEHQHTMTVSPIDAFFD